MTLGDERTTPPDVDRLARSMLQLLGEDHQDHPAPAESDGHGGGSWRKAPDFASDPDRAAAVRALRRSRGSK